MNVKKYLRKQAKNDQQEILTSDNGELLRSLEERVVKSPTPLLSSLAKKILAGAASALAAIIILVCVLVFYPSTDAVIYLEENFDSYNSDLSSLNRDTQEFSLFIDPELFSAEIKKTIDSISGDVIFYEANIFSLDTLIYADIVVVCNKYYKYKDFHETEEFIEAKLPQYTVSYLTSISHNPSFGIDTMSGFAMIHLGVEYVYITNYSELMLDVNGSFLKFIQDIVLTKQTREATLSSIAKN